MSKAIDDVVNERQRQKNVKGWTEAHDNEHDTGELAFAASCYSFHAGCNAWFPEEKDESVPKQWPWDDEYWKPKSAREDLVRAAALIIAEIERLDRKN